MNTCGITIIFNDTPSFSLNIGALAGVAQRAVGTPLRFSCLILRLYGFSPVAARMPEDDRRALFYRNCNF